MRVYATLCCCCADKMEELYVTRTESERGEKIAKCEACQFVGFTQVISWDPISGKRRLKKVVERQPRKEYTGGFRGGKGGLSVLEG